MFTLTYITDLIERVVRTFVQAFGGVLVAMWIDAGSLDALDWSLIWQSALYAGVGAVLVGLFAKPIGDPNSASLGR